MKKLLALVLALVMTLSLCTVTNAAAFKDAENVEKTYAEAVDVLNGLGVFKGYEDGSFSPKGNITRAEVAAIVYRLYTGDVKDKQADLYAGYGKFSDMTAAKWAAGYVGFCANAGFIKGYGDGKFGPADSVTGYQALAMILRAVGYGKNGEFEGTDWELHVAQIAQQLDVLKNVKAVSLKTAATRELVAELLFQVASDVETVTYTPAFGYVKTRVVEEENKTLGEKNFDLAKVEGVVTAVDYKNGKTFIAQEWDEDVVGVVHGKVVSETKADMKWIGYAVHTWTVDGDKESATVDAITDVYVDGESLGTCTNGAAFADMIDDDEDDFVAKLDADDDTIGGEESLYFKNGLWISKNDAETFFADGDSYGNGVYVDFVDNDGKGEAEAIVILDYTVAEVIAVNDGTSTGKNDKDDDSIILDVDGVEVEIETKYVVTEDKLEEGDLVTFIACGYEVDNDDLIGMVDADHADEDTNVYYYVIKATTVTGKYTEYDKNGIYTVGGKDYEDAVDVLDDSALTDTPDDENYKLWLDPFGYILDSEKVTDPDQYLFVISNEDTESNDKNVEAVVAFADGTTKKVLVNKIDGTKVSDMGSLDDDALANEIYTYTESDGKYAITPAGATYIDPDNPDDNDAYETNDRTWDGVDVTLDTVVVDLRDYEKVGDKGVVKTGYKNIPTVDRDVELYYVTEEDGDDTNMVIGFLLDGETAKKYDAASFVVFNTSVTEKATKTSKVDTTAYTLKKGVIENNKLVENYSLGVEDNETVDNEAYKYLNDEGYGVSDTGVGFYSFDKEGNLDNYISFAEEQGTFEWNKTTGVNKFAGTRMYNWDLPENYWLLDIDDGKATSYKLGKSGELENAFILMASDSDSDITRDSKDSIVAIFVLKDAELAATTGAASEWTKPLEGGTRYFYAEEGKVTAFENVYDVPTYTVTLVNNVGKVTASLSNTNDVTSMDVEKNATVTVYIKNATGYENGEWHVAVNGEQRPLDNQPSYSITVTEDTEIVITGTNATPIVYNITYVLDDTDKTGSATHAATYKTTYTIEDTVTSADFTTASLTGYTFTGWDSTGWAAGTTGDKTLTAQWTENRYDVTVTYKVNTHDHNGDTYGNPDPASLANYHVGETTYEDALKLMGINKADITPAAPTGYTDYVEYSVADGAFATNGAAVTITVTYLDCVNN